MILYLSWASLNPCSFASEKACERVPRKPIELATMRPCSSRSHAHCTRSVAVINLNRQNRDCGAIESATTPEPLAFKCIDNKYKACSEHGYWAGLDPSRNIRYVC